MITFKNFLSEDYSPRTNSITFEDAVNIAKENCKNYLTSNKIPSIIRGIRQKGDMRVGIGDPHSRKRASRNTTNEYNLIVSNFDNWKDYPPRDNSFICANFSARNIASAYGTTYAIIPFDNAKIGVCPSNDFWNSFNHLKSTVKDVDFIPGPERLNAYLASLMEPVGYDRYKEIDFNKFGEYIKKADALFKKIDKENLYKQYEEKYVGFRAHKDLVKFIVNNYSNLGWFLADVLDPEKNGFEITDEKGISKFALGQQRELWTDAKCIFLRLERSVAMAENDKPSNMYNTFRDMVLK